MRLKELLENLACDSEDFSSISIAFLNDKDYSMVRKYLGSYEYMRDFTWEERIMFLEFVILSEAK